MTSSNGLCSMTTTFTAASERKPNHTHVLLITTGSVASIKAPLIVAELLTYQNVAIEVVSTKSALTFFEKDDITKLGVRVWTDHEEWDVSL